MKKRDRQPRPPVERSQTIRQRMIECLGSGPVSTSTLSGEVGLPERRILAELDSLKKQVKLVVCPARCVACDFEFKDRNRVGKPGKCPRCRSTRIEQPLYSLAEP